MPTAPLDSDHGHHGPQPGSPPAAWAGLDVSNVPVAWCDDLVAAIGVLCQQPAPAMQSWSVQVPLDPAALPESQLRLTLSAHVLQLRFRTDSAWTQRVLWAHRLELHQRLERELGESRSIDIEIT